MKKFIKQRLREEMIDGQNMNSAMQTMCNKLTVNSYNEVLKYVEESLKGVSEENRHKVMQKIHAPLENLKHEEIRLTDEENQLGMTGDSLPDEADTYWHQIQSTICEMGSSFQ